MNDATGQTVLVSVAEHPQAAARLWGPQDAHRRLLERRLQVRLSTRGTAVAIQGDPPKVEFAERVVTQLLRVAAGGGTLFLQDIEQAIHMLGLDQTADVAALRREPVLTTHEQRNVAPKTPTQRTYLHAMANHDLTFGVGPAGTGKTYLAMAAAVAAFQRREVKRIILARPAVEAGEKLGFLPGNLAEKVNPYLRPLYDALYDMMEPERAGRLIESGLIEVAPLAFMRGRTLNHSFVILDEAQNTTRDQMKMFLTRLGFSSKAVVTGDMSQTDLPPNKESGLEHAVGLLQGVEGIAVVRFTHVDVVRHPLVQRIVQAYDAEESH